MTLMHSTGSRTPRPPRRRHSALFVLVVLAGLLGMHALAPGGGMVRAQHVHTVHRAVAFSAPDGCPGDGGHCGGNHLHHADPTCASGAVGGAPHLPALVADPVITPEAASAVRSCAVGAPDGARAPPSLAELQLLRI